MKKFRTLFLSLLTLCLALALFAGLSVPAQAAATDVDGTLAKAFGLSSSELSNYATNYKNALPIDYVKTSGSYYVALGGDTAYGEVSGGTWTDSYFDQILAKMGINGYNAAKPGLVAKDSVSYLTTYKKAVNNIPKADLITFQLDGISLISGSLSGALHGGSPAWEDYVSDASALSELRSFRSRLAAEYATVYGQENATKVAVFMEYMLYECISYGHETIETVEKLHSINGNATIIVLGLYNPLRNLKFTANGKTIDVGDMLDQMIRVCNVYLLKKTGSMAKVGFLDVSAAQTVGFGTMQLDINNLDALEKKLYSIQSETDKQYANKSGHLYIATQVVENAKAPCSHPGTTVVGKKAATCKEAGYTGDTVCSSCGKVTKAGSVIEKTQNHSFGAWTKTKDPTCSVRGENSRTCSICGKVEISYINTISHSFDQGSVTTEPGCETKGVKTFRCVYSGCTESYTEEIPAIGHLPDNGKITKEPGCETNGVKTYTCTRSGCGKTSTETIAPIGHAFDAGKITKEPGCETKGVKTYTCTHGCGKTTTESVPATGHSYDSGKITTHASCETNGVKTFTCVHGCGKSYTEPVPAIGHLMDSGKITKEPGCETNGVKTYTCTRSGCGKTSTESIPAIGHAFDDGKITKEPGCETNGVKTYTCTRSGCGKTSTESIPAIGHAFDDGKITKEPGCETKGVKTYTCTHGCGKTTTESVPATGHSWDNGTITVQPKCESKGTKTYTCTDCNKTKTESVSATGHSWDEGTVTKASGCETEGTKTLTCTACGKTKTETVPPTGHTWNEGVVTTHPQCEVPGEKTVTCLSCGKMTTEVIPATDHSWDEGTVTTRPQCEAPGEKTVTCLSCGKTNVEVIPATDHNWDAGVVTHAPTYEQEGEKTYTCDTCKKTKTETLAKLVKVDEIVSSDIGGVKVNTPEGSSAVLNENTSLKVESVSGAVSEDARANVEIVFGKSSEVLAVYDISLILDGVAVQPGGMVEVTLPAPGNLGEYDRLQVVFVDDEGNVTPCETRINEDGTLTFRTDHFSHYAVVGISEGSSAGWILWTVLGVLLVVGGAAAVWVLLKKKKSA